MLARQDVGSLHLPGTQRDVAADRGFLETFFGERVLGEQAERSQVIVGLGSEARAVTGGGDARLECDEGILANRLVSGECDVADTTVGGAHAEAQATERIARRGQERRQENAAREVAVVGGGAVTQSVVGHAVEHAGSVVHAPVEKIAGELKADVAAGDKQRR